MLIKLNNRTIKILLLFLSIFAIQSVLLLVLLLRPQISSAAIGVRAEGSNNATCPCGFKAEQDAEKETIRLFIPIPGVTDGCGYLCDINGDSKGDVVDYVVAIYKFLVGAAAIMAVFMIMVGGYQWIFAMGSSSAIESAKDTIKSALFGLLLTLFSYQVLHFINPRLTDVVLPEVQEIGRMQVGGYLCGGDDVLVDDEGFNTMLVGSFAEAIKEGKKLAKTEFYLQFTHRQGSGYGASSPPFTIDENKLILGLHPASATATKDILKCDNEAKSYLVPTTKGGTIYKNPSGPEVKIAHFNTAKVTDKATDTEKIKVVGIDCFYGLCDISDKGLVDSSVALANANTLKDYAEDYYKEKEDYIFNKDEVEIYNSVSTRVEPKGGGCYGSFCDPVGEGLTLCLSRSGIGIGCYNISQMCTDTDKNMCEETDQMLQTSFASTMQTGIGELPVACRKRVDQEMNPDQCVLGIKFGCPIGYPQIDPLTSYAKETDINWDACWREDTKKKEKKKLDCWKSAVANYAVFPVDSGFAVDKISAVCCEERQNVPGENYGKFQGICVESFDAAYSTQTFKALKEICDARSDQTDPSCKVLTTSTYITQWDGNCELQTGFIDGQLQKASVCMLPPDKEKKPTTKVCHLGKKDHVMYADAYACAVRHAGEKWLMFTSEWIPQIWKILYTQKVTNCDSYILPSDYPCLDLPAAGSFKEGTGTVDGGDTGDITGKIENIKSLIVKNSDIKNAIQTEGDKFKVDQPDWQAQRIPTQIGLLSPLLPISILPINTASAASPDEIDFCKFVEVLIARETGGEKDPVKAISCNTDGSCDCGLMQINIAGVGCSKKTDCETICENKNYFNIDTNIQAGIKELANYFEDPRCEAGTSCSATDGTGDSEKRYRWMYTIARYNGKDTANQASEDCPINCGKYPKCKDIPEKEKGCFIGPVDLTPTQVECPYNDTCLPEEGEYRTITYSYVEDMFAGYKYIKDQSGDGVASCP